MKTIPLDIATVLYIWQFANFAIAGDKGMAVAFFGYALANIGLILAAS